MTDPLAQSEASAALYDLVAVGFSYPGEQLFNALIDGSFSATAAANAACVDNPEQLLPALERLVSGVQILADTYTRDKLESEYLALFELNRAESAVHLYGHLYVHGKRDPGPVYRHLQDIYRAFGVELKPDEPCERPDHLTVELEFLSYLYRLLNSMLRDHKEDGIAEVQQGIESFLGELVWVNHLVERLEERSEHPFYVPLGRFLCTLMQASRVLPGES
jgi:DMSO reductase family type II enzyme chaperone